MGKSDKFGEQQHFELVPRPISDPLYYDETAPKFVLMPLQGKVKQRKNQPNVDSIGNENIAAESMNSEEIPKLISSNPYVKKKVSNKDEEEPAQIKESAADYGILYDDKNYDYMQHLKPIGQDPDAVFVAAPEPTTSKKNEASLEYMFGNLLLKENENEKPNFEFGRATDKYLERQVDILDSIKGFKPDMDPRLKEVLTALDDEAYVVNQDVNVDKSVRDKLSKNEIDLNELGDLDEDNFFSELLQGGEGNGEEIYSGELNEENWDLDEFEDQYFDDENFDAADFQEEEITKKEIVNNEDPFNVENIAKLNEISWGQDMRTMKKQQKEHNEEDNEIDSMNMSDEPEEEDEFDAFGELPTFNTTRKTGNNSRKQRRKKGAMSDISGFSMSSSAIPRTEIMTVLDDKFDQVIGGYENYEEEQYDDDYEEFDMKKERDDLDGLLDDFLDNYELSEGGRKLAKKSDTADRIQLAADNASKNNKHAVRRMKERDMSTSETSKKKSNAW